MAASVENKRRLLVIEGDAVPIEKAPDLGLATGPVRWLKSGKPGFEFRIWFLVHAFFTSCDCLPTCLAAAMRRASVRSMSLNNFSLCCWSFDAASRTSDSAR